MIRREHGVEFSAQRAHEHGIGRERTRGVERRRGGPQQAIVLVAEEPAFAGVRVERAQGEARRRDAPPVPQRVGGDAPRLHDALRRHRCDRVPQREVRRHEHDAQPPRRQHHGHGNITGDMGEEFRYPGKAIAGGVQRQFVDRSGDDGVGFTGERESRRGLDILCGRPTRLDVARRPSRSAVLPAADDADICVERLPQRFAHHFGTDPSRVAHGHRETRPGRWGSQG